MRSRPVASIVLTSANAFWRCAPGLGETLVGSARPRDRSSRWQNHKVASLLLELDRVIVAQHGLGLQRSSVLPPRPSAEFEGSSDEASAMLLDDLIRHRYRYQVAPQ